MSVAHHLPLPLLFCTVVAGLGAQGHHGLDPANLDTSCVPCQDFYRYSNGGWLARTTLGAEYASYGGFTELIERNNETLGGTVDRLAAAAPATPKTTEQKLGAFYASCMDSASAEQAGAEPLKNELDRIAAIASPRDLVQALARGHRHGWEPLFNLGASPDFKNSTVMGTTASQGGLGLPDRDSYLRPRRRQLGHGGTARRLARLPALARRQPPRPLALEPVRGRGLSVPARAHRRERPAAALEALPPGRELPDGRRPRPGIREADLPPGGPAPRPGHRRRAPPRPGRAAADARVEA